MTEFFTGIWGKTLRELSEGIISLQDWGIRFLSAVVSAYSLPTIVKIG